MTGRPRGLAGAGPDEILYPAVFQAVKRYDGKASAGMQQPLGSLEAAIKAVASACFDSEDFKAESERIEDSYKSEEAKAFAELERDPEKLREWAFDSHSDAYLDAGFAERPADDIVKIATTPRFEDFFSNDALKEAGEVGVQALVDNPSLAAEIPPAALRRVGELAKDGAINLAGNVVDGISDLANGVTDFAGDVAEGAGDVAGTVVDGVAGGVDRVLGGLGL